MLQIAKILKSNGVEGGLLVSAPEFDLETIKGPVLIEFDGLPVPFFMEECTPRGVNKYIIRLTDVCSLKDAEEMVGRDIYIESDGDDSAEDGVDFIGWKVYDRGELLGEVCDTEPIHGNFCLYVSRGDEEIMIPLHENFIESVDSDSSSLFLDLPEGLY